MSTKNCEHTELCLWRRCRSPHHAYALHSSRQCAVLPASMLDTPRLSDVHHDPVEVLVQKIPGIAQSVKICTLNHPHTHAATYNNHDVHNSTANTSNAHAIMTCHASHPGKQPPHSARPLLYTINHHLRCHHQHHNILPPSSPACH